MQRSAAASSIHSFIIKNLLKHQVTDQETVVAFLVADK